VFDFLNSLDAAMQLVYVLIFVFAGLFALVLVKSIVGEYWRGHIANRSIEMARLTLESRSTGNTQDKIKKAQDAERILSEIASLSGVAKRKTIYEQIAPDLEKVRAEVNATPIGALIEHYAYNKKSTDKVVPFKRPD
jgi:hypothetical protein